MFVQRQRGRERGLGACADRLGDHGAVLDQDESGDAERIERRLQLRLVVHADLSNLVSAGGTVGSLAKELGCTQANTSKQLALLADAGLLFRRREGLRCYYAIADPAVFEICDTVCASVFQHLDPDAFTLRSLSR